MLSAEELSPLSVKGRLAPVPFKGTEDRLNPVTPAGVDESTLGGYPAVHGRAPGFEGIDGSAYTVAIETERSEAGDGTWVVYLVFLRWAEGGTAIMGHLETEDVASAPSEREAREAAEALSLARVKVILDQTIERKQRWEAESPSRDVDAEAG